MELATGGERTIDGIADGERIVLGHPKTREAMRAGLAMYFVTLDDDELMEIADRIVARARDRVVLQHPARRRARDRGEPADLDDRLPGGPEPPVARGQARARRDLRRRARGAALARPPGPHGAALLRPGRVRRGERVTHCPVNTAGIPWANVQALRAQGRRRAARRLQPLPPAPRGRRRPRPPRRPRAAAARRSGARSRSSRPRPTSSTSTSGSRCPEVAPVPAPARCCGKRSVMHFLGSDIRGKPPAQLAVGEAGRRARRRLLRRDPLGAGGARRPTGDRPRRHHALAAVRPRAAPSCCTRLVAVAEGNRARHRRLRAGSAVRALDIVEGLDHVAGVRALPRRRHRRRPAERRLVRHVRDRGDGARQAGRHVPARGGGAQDRGGVRRSRSRSSTRRRRRSSTCCDRSSASPGELRRIGAASRAYVERVHDIDRVADRLLDLYARLWSEPRPRAEAARPPLRDLRARRARLAHPRDGPPAALHALPAAERVRPGRDRHRGDGGARDRAAARHLERVLPLLLRREGASGEAHGRPHLLLVHDGDVDPRARARASSSPARSGTGSGSGTIRRSCAPAPSGSGRRRTTSS